MRFNGGYALAIAPGSYKNAPQLHAPITVEDAREVAAVLRDERYCGYPEKQIALLHNASATRQGILSALDDLARLEKRDTLLLFYSGHGEYGEDGYYLTTHDTELNDRNKVVAGSGISEVELLEKIKAIAAKRVILIFNACHSGEISPDSLGSPTPEALGMSGGNLPNLLANALLGTGEGRIIITACRENQKSYFSRNGATTVFAQFLADGLRGRDIVPRRGYISVFDLYDYIYTGTKAEVRRRFGFLQEPELTIQKGIGAMAVALHRGKTPDGELGSGDMPESLKGALREIKSADSQRLLEQILSGEINLAAGGDIKNVEVVRGDKTGGDRIDAKGSTGFINKPKGFVKQHIGDKTSISTGGGDYAGRDLYKGTAPDYPAATVSLSEIRDRIGQKVKEAEERGEDELAEDLQQVEGLLKSAETAENKGDATRKESRLKNAREELQKIAATNSDLQSLASLLKQVQ